VNARVPPGYRQTVPIKRPKLDGFTEIIDRWLGDDVQHQATPYGQAGF
jgi:hypothetical protein